MLETCKPYLLVGLGSALGGMGRLWASTVIGRHWGDTFPWGTLVVNVTGSFAIGMFAALTGPGGRWTVDRHVALFIVTGIFGGYTTFSAFSLQTLQLARDGQWGQAGGNIALSVVLCLIGVVAGFWIGQMVNRAVS
jgi:CrcB protein